MNIIRRNYLAAALAALTFAGAAAVPARADDRIPGANRLDYLTGYLSLTDSQKTQAQAIFDAASTAATTAQGQLTAAREALTVAWKANRADAEIDRLAAAAGTVEGQLAAIHAKANAKFYALLTADQKTKYDALGTRGAGGGGGRNRAG